MGFPLNNTSFYETPKRAPDQNSRASGAFFYSFCNKKKCPISRANIVHFNTILCIKMLVIRWQGLAESNCYNQLRRLAVYH